MAILTNQLIVHPTKYMTSNSLAASSNALNKSKSSLLTNSSALSVKRIDENANVVAATNTDDIQLNNNPVRYLPFTTVSRDIDGDVITKL